jgi:hypothetical protein
MDDIYYEASKRRYKSVHVDANVVQSGRLEIEVVDASLPA